MRSRAGYTLVELLVALVVFAIVSAGAMGFFHANRRIAEAEEIRSTLTANLRIAMQRITDTVRSAGYGMPPGAPGVWFPWAPGYVSGAISVVEGTGTDPDAVSIVTCTTAPVAVLAADVVAGAVVASVDDTGAVDRASRRAVLIDDAEHAHVRGVGASVLTLDTDPLAPGLQPLAASYPQGTPICRLDVVSFAVDPMARRLLKSVHDDAGFRTLVDDISDLQIETLASGERYRIVLTARSGRRNPVLGGFPTQTLASTVSLRN